MFLKEKIILFENECGECGRRFFEIKRRPLNYCPHCRAELTFFNSQFIREEVVEVGIDFRTGEAKILEKRNVEK